MKSPQEMSDKELLNLLVWPKDSIVRAELLRRLGASGVDAEGLAREAGKRIARYLVANNSIAFLSYGDEDKRASEISGILAAEIRKHIAQPAGEWNLAIEAAAKEADHEGGFSQYNYSRGCKAVAHRIRGLLRPAPKEKDNG